MFGIQVIMMPVLAIGERFLGPPRKVIVRVLDGAPILRALDD